MQLGILPGENDWLHRLKGQPTFGGLLGVGGDQPAGLLGRLNSALTDPNAALGLRILANSGPNQFKRGLGEIIGQSALETQAANAQQQQQQLQQEFMRAQIERMRAPQKPDIPNSVAEYEYARQNGYTGSFDQWKTMGGSQGSMPASIQEWQFFNTLPPADQKRFLDMKRQPAAPQLTVIGGVPTLVDRISGQQTPLSSLGAETSAASSKAEAAAVGQTRGEVAGQVDKRAAGANRTLSTIQQAEKVIDGATGSLAGAGADAIAGAVGYTTPGAAATAKLKVLQANLMTEMPRMEGPQSDRDVQLYREAAGQIGDPKVPRGMKKAALEQIKDIQKRYAGQSSGGASSAPKRVKVDANGNVINGN